MWNLISTHFLTQMQRAEMEELRQREANVTALLAIGPRKKLKTDPDTNNIKVS